MWVNCVSIRVGSGVCNRRVKERAQVTRLGLRALRRIARVTKDLKVPLAKLRDVKRHAQNGRQAVVDTSCRSDAVERQIGGQSTVLAAASQDTHQPRPFLLRPYHLPAHSAFACAFFLFAFGVHWLRQFLTHQRTLPRRVHSVQHGTRHRKTTCVTPRARLHGLESVAKLPARL